MFNEANFTPQNVRAWREFTSYKTPFVEKLTVKELGKLSDAEREAYDEKRIAQINAWAIFRTPVLESLRRQLRITTAMNRGSQFTARQGLVVSGSQTLGKSTAALYLGRAYEAEQRASKGLIDDNTYAPVVYLPVPASATTKGLMLAFANYLEVPVSPRANSDVVAQQVTRILQEQGTSLVILDEVQNLKTQQALGREAASFLKLFTERLAATFVYVGVDLPNSDLFSGEMGAQLRGRVTMQNLAPYSQRSAEGRETWLNLIHAIEMPLPLAKHQTGMLDDCADLLFDLTGGVIGSLRNLLRRAATSAVLDGKEFINRQTILDTPLDFRAQSEQTKTGGKQTRARKAA